MRVQHVDLLLDHIVNRHRHVRGERLRLLKAVFEIHEHRILSQSRRVRCDVRDDHHVGGVLHEDAGVAMIRMIVVRPRREDEVRVPLPNLPDDLLAHRERRQQLAVVIVEDDVLDADSATGFARFGATPRGERAAAFGLMAGVAVGHRHESHAVAEGRVLRRNASGALIAVVGMRAERDDVQLAIRGRSLRALRGRLRAGRRARVKRRSVVREQSGEDERRESRHDDQM